MMTPFARNIKAIREYYGLTQEGLSEALGLNSQTAGRWESKNMARPRQSGVVELIKEKFNVTDQDLFGFTDGFYAKTHGLPGMVPAFTTNTMAPILGDIAAGDPREAIQNFDGELWVPPHLLEEDPDSFYLRVTSNSMNKYYRIGDYVLVSPNSEVHNGDIAVVKVNGDEATVKRWKRDDDAVFLIPESTDPSFKRIIIDETDPDAPLVKPIGKVKWHYPMSNYRD